MARHNRCKHGNVICSQCVVITDAAKRMSDQINARVIFTPPDELFHNPYMGFRLADGYTDGILYPSKADAIRHQSNEFLYCFFSFRRAMSGASAKDCQLFLAFHRHAYDNGFRLADPDTPELIMPLARGQGPWPL